MMDVKQAAKIAAEYFVDLYAEQKYSDMLLEEVEYDEAGGAWLITLGYSPPRTILEDVKDPFSPLSRLSSFSTIDRRYKIFRIDAETSNVFSMKIRTLEPA